MNYKKIYMLIMLINLNQKFLSRVFQKVLSILFFINFYNSDSFIHWFMRIVPVYF